MSGCLFCNVSVFIKCQKNSAGGEGGEKSWHNRRSDALDDRVNLNIIHGI